MTKRDELRAALMDIDKIDRQEIMRTIATRISRGGLVDCLINELSDAGVAKLHKHFVTDQLPVNLKEVISNPQRHSFSASNPDWPGATGCYFCRQPESAHVKPTPTLPERLQPDWEPEGSAL